MMVKLSESSANMTAHAQNLVLSRCWTTVAQGGCSRIRHSAGSTRAMRYDLLLYFHPHSTDVLFTRDY